MHFNFLPILDYLPQTSLKVIFGYCGSPFLPANSKLHLLYVYVIIFSVTTLWALNVLSFSLALWHLWLRLFTTGHLRTLAHLATAFSLPQLLLSTPLHTLLLFKAHSSYFWKSSPTLGRSWSEILYQGLNSEVCPRVLSLPTMEGPRH